MEDITIHEFDFALINEFFTELERQGPGSSEETIRALSFIRNLSNKTKIADLGCGTGAQTMVLAQNTEAAITALGVRFHGIVVQNQPTRRKKNYGTNTTRKRPNDRGNPPSNTT